MKVIALKCSNCGDIIWSRAQYDFRECSCGSIAIDGGPNPHKFIGSGYIQMEIKIDKDSSDQRFDRFLRKWFKKYPQVRLADIYSTIRK